MLKRDIVPLVVASADRALGGCRVIAITAASGQDTGAHDERQKQAEKSDCFFHKIQIHLSVLVLLW